MGARRCDGRRGHICSGAIRQGSDGEHSRRSESCGTQQDRSGGRDGPGRPARSSSGSTPLDPPQRAGRPEGGPHAGSRRSWPPSRRARPPRPGTGGRMVRPAAAWGWASGRPVRAAGPFPVGGCAGDDRRVGGAGARTWGRHWPAVGTAGACLPRPAWRTRALFPWRPAPAAERALGRATGDRRGEHAFVKLRSPSDGNASCKGSCRALERGRTTPRPTGKLVRDRPR